VETGWCSEYDVPKSPSLACFTKVMNCAANGLSRPLAALKTAIRSAALAFVPRVALAALPGSRWISRNVTIMTPITTTSAWPVPRRRWAVTAGPS
jgi:hypothetical protein